MFKRINQQIIDEVSKLRSLKNLKEIETMFREDMAKGRVLFRREIKKTLLLDKLMALFLFVFLFSIVGIFYTSVQLTYKEILIPFFVISCGLSLLIGLFILIKYTLFIKTTIHKRISTLEEELQHHQKEQAYMEREKFLRKRAMFLYVKEKR